MEDASSPHSPPHGDDSHSTSHSSTSSDSSTFSESTPSLARLATVPPHTVVRLIQCSRCSLPLRAPLRLPCGDTLCQACLPPVRPRLGVSYPANEERKQGFTCYRGMGGCGGDHCLGDCGVDVLLTRLVGVFEEVLGGGADREDAGKTLVWKGAQVGEAEVGEQSAEIGSDPLRGVFELIKRARFGYDALEIRYQPFVSCTRTLDRLRAAVRNELDCHVCYSLILDPLTTPCGHTFCRGCVTLALSHSNLCPICRRRLNMSLSVGSERINKRLSDLTQTFFPDEVASRRADLASDIDVGGEEKIPMAVVSLAFPTMPVGLHIFEPRYRLMIQRVMESRSRRFGMVMPNRGGRLQRGLGRAPFMQYGTMLAINRHELLPDGRSLLIATGTSRFKVVSWELVDGYHVGKIQRIDDVSISEEEAQESRETAAAIESTSSTVEKPIDSMSTQQLFQLAIEFVLKERSRGAPWLHPRVLLAYGSLPTDPALFPWWFATILPKWDEDKYTLLSTTTVRQRLKITARWVKRLETRPWYVARTPQSKSKQLNQRSSGVVTSFTPFSMSVSISFGPGGAVSHFGGPGLVATDGSESYISQSLVLGLFLAIFATQMTVSVVQAVRARQRARVGGTPPAQTRREQPGIPAEVQDEVEGRGQDPTPGRHANSDLNPS
ncbi:PUA-like domain-containing protein [Aspergillus aurantiobrunneus]